MIKKNKQKTTLSQSVNDLDKKWLNKVQQWRQNIKCLREALPANSNDVVVIFPY